MSQINFEVEAIKTQPSISDLADFCKGIAISLIILFHLKGGWFGWQGVHIFIVLSGFGLMYSCLKQRKKIAWKEWYNKRFTRILPTYWLILSIGCIIMIALHFLDPTIAIKPIIVGTFLSFFLANVFSYNYLSTIPNYSLWFIPLIISFYIIFPIIYKALKQKDTFSDYMWFFTVLILIEFIYRGVGIYFFNGHPIASEQGTGLPTLPLPEFNLIDSLGHFQGIAPFGFSLSRIGEFGIGILIAVATVKNSDRTSKVMLKNSIFFIGLLLWFLGNAFTHLEPWGWIFSDFFIALGLFPCCLRLASLIKSSSSFLYSRICFIGKYSYYLFLCNFLVIYIFLYKLKPELDTLLNLKDDFLNIFCMKAYFLGITITGIYLLSLLVKRFDDLQVINQVTRRFFNS